MLHFVLPGITSYVYYVQQLSNNKNIAVTSFTETFYLEVEKP